jgi:hypothetical protein
MLTGEAIRLALRPEQSHDDCNARLSNTCPPLGATGIVIASPGQVSDNP